MMEMKMAMMKIEIKMEEMDGDRDGGDGRR